jgi:TetR/AcrR family transcriptional regulator
MARPRREPRPRDAGATRQALLAAAAASFAEHGFAGARVDEIAARAGVNKALIYAHFGDKDGLYREVISSRLAAPEVGGTVAGAAGPRAALEALVRWWFRLLASDPAFARLLAWDLLSGTPRRRAILLESAAPALALVGDLVRRGVAAGELRAGLEPEPFRAAVVALCLGYFLQRPAERAAGARLGRRFTDEEFLDHTCRLLFSAPPAAPPGAALRSGTARSRPAPRRPPRGRRP